MTDETTGALRFRPSACGRFIVAWVGSARPHVLTIEEAEATAQAYAGAAERFGAAGQLGAARYELSTANLIRMAIAEAVVS